MSEVTELLPAAVAAVLKRFKTERLDGSVTIHVNNGKPAKIEHRVLESLR